MPTGQLIFFAGWLALAMLGGVLIVVVWEWLRARYPAGDDSAPQPKSSAGADS